MKACSMVESQPFGTTEADLAPLTKRKRDGTLYQRSPEAVAEIVRAMDRPIDEFERNVQHVSVSCLIYFCRHLRPNRESAWYNNAVLELLARLDAAVARKCRGMADNRRDHIRHEVQGWMIELLYTNDEKLDVLETMFNLAVDAKTVDEIRKSERRVRVERNESEFVTNDMSSTDAIDNIHHANQPPVLAKAEASAQLDNAMGKLTGREQEAIMNVYGKGLKETSNDPDEMTAAKAMNVSDRRIRQLITNAKKKLSDDEGSNP